MTGLSGTIEEQLKDGEKILWYGREVQKIANQRAVHNKMLPAAVIWGVLLTAFFIYLAVQGGFGASLFIIYLLMLLPVWLYLARVEKAKNESRYTYFAMTTRGIYLQTCLPNSSAKTCFISYEDLVRAEPEAERFGEEENVGSIRCIYIERKAVSSHDELVFKNVFDYRKIAQQINEQAERFTKAAPDTVRTVEEQTEDAKQAFFGRPALNAFGAQHDFLDLQAAAEMRERLSAENQTVSGLQQELFGDEAPQTQVIPDPTVNPLPELPEQNNHTDESRS